MKIIVDQRERNLELINALHENGVEVEIKTIPVGDYILSDRICVERKTVSDFESSIINGLNFRCSSAGTLLAYSIGLIPPLVISMTKVQEKE